MNPTIFNLLNGLLLCLLGLWSNSLHYEFAPYFIVLGAVLIGLTYFVRKSHKVLGGLAMMSTILSTVILGFLFYSSFGNTSIFQAPLGMMLISGVLSSSAFIQCAVNHNSSEEKACCEQPADGTACCDKSQSKEENAKAVGCC